MATIIKDLGPVSAYAYAVTQGYTGTEEEFAELMADYADVGQRAEDAAESALNSKTVAQTAAQTATTKASEASTSATSASGSASAASASASAASGSATSAANSATAASGSATAAAGSATTASTKASEASASATAAQTAQTAAEAAQSAAETAQGKAEDAQEAAEDAAESVSASAAQIATNAVDIAELKSEVSQKANVDGAYSDLTAGNAEQLVSTVYEEDSVPYIFRTAGGFIDIGDREEDMLVGGTVVWNQLVQNGNFTDTTSWIAQNASLAASGGVATITPSNNNSSSLILQSMSIKDHVYFAAFSVNTPSSTGVVNFEMRDASSIRLLCASSQTGQWERCKAVSKIASSNASGYIRIRTDTAQTTGQAFTVKDVVLIDLTQLFGSTIADYIYSLRQATPDAGVAWFKKLFPADYYPYDSGTLKSVEGVSSHNMVGFNQWDFETDNIGKNLTANGALQTSARYNTSDYIKVIPKTQYYLKNVPGSTYAFAGAWYDINKNFISVIGISGNSYVVSGIRESPENAYYVRLSRCITEAAANEACINLSWDGERNGEYEPYVKHSYPLDSSLTLRGIPKLDSANNLYYDGDTYESDGTVTRKYGVVDLGTLGTWMEYSGYPGLFYLNTVPSGAKIPASNTVLPSLIANGYIAGISRDIGNSGHTKGEIALAQNRIYISNDAYTGNASGFRTAISGVYLVYELATPTTETAEPYQNPQIVDDFGTEEYVTTSIVPVGHVTKYQPNLRAKLEMSPDSPDGDGDYIVRQANGENSYVSLASTATIQDILARLTALEGNTNEG